MLFPQKMIYFTVRSVYMLEDFKMPVADLKENILDVWRRL